MTLRIAHVNSALAGGGTDEQCFALAARLRQLGQCVWLAGPGENAYAKRIAAAGLQFFATKKSFFARSAFCLSCARLLRRERIQIVHAHHGRDIWLAIIAARLSGRNPRIVITRHLAKSPGSWFSRQFLLSQCDALIAVSESVAKILREGAYEPNSHEAERHSRPPIRGNHRKIHVCYGGIDTDLFRPSDATAQRAAWGLSPEHFAFAVVGGYELPRGKGQREYLEAAARIHEQIPHVRFLIVGRGNMKAVLEADIQRLGLAGKAWLTSYSQNMPMAMNAIDCLVHPQVGTEALGLVVCEAHACGKPVITTALDGIPEAFHVAGYGQLIPPESVAALAAAMLHWARQRPLALPEREALHDRVAAAFSIDVSARNLLALYQQLMPEQKP